MNAAALAAFRARGHAQREALRPGTIQIGATEYACALHRGEIQNMKTDGGWIRVQEMVAHVDKTLLTAGPPGGTDITDLADNVVFRFRSCGGDLAGAPAWILRCSRKL